MQLDTVRARRSLAGGRGLRSRARPAITGWSWLARLVVPCFRWSGAIQAAAILSGGSHRRSTRQGGVAVDALLGLDEELVGIRESRLAARPVDASQPGQTSVQVTSVTPDTDR